MSNTERRARARVFNVREPLLGAIADRIRSHMGDRASRRYLSVLRVGQRAPDTRQPAG